MNFASIPSEPSPWMPCRRLIPAIPARPWGWPGRLCPVDPFPEAHPENPEWLDRDRFVLSGGHASMLLYSLLHLTGYDLSLRGLKNFRQWGSLTPGHPESDYPGSGNHHRSPGTGICQRGGHGHGGTAPGASFNRPGLAIVDHFTYIMCGDGDMMEGVTSEAASLAGHLKLAKLIVLYDDNGISIEEKPISPLPKTWPGVSKPMAGR